MAEAEVVIDTVNSDDGDKPWSYLFKTDRPVPVDEECVEVERIPDDRIGAT